MEKCGGWRKPDFAAGRGGRANKKQAVVLSAR